ncbi:uncharacterized protein LOC125653835 [Ostrea edulis]|uniref:uncharacterized protein LOC125653835 n=1 Tax=Ostrea edulis TaxID=37623 RepID=UPI002094A7F7|nr:uncharacterized protein LOC125653835 [Ostrea edulis]XP_055999554.1 uncharacterized protein LOC125653835 [Ostrea edulis]XP_055999555.1 uncharacterized protein LOC125653835 [Ostrea edulis]XP_055999556.1 uncharacterized protein LOC125653835 [Ostrea edulis]
MMNPRYCSQDLIRCDLCETAMVQMYCDFCNVKLCITCIGQHISDAYDKHKVVPFKQRMSTLIYPKCAVHENKRNKFQCLECDMWVCSMCISSETHKWHAFKDLSAINKSKKESIRREADELNDILSPTYEDIVSDIQSQIANLDVEYENLSVSIMQRGEEWHKEVDTVINEMKHEIDEMKDKHLDILKKHLEEIIQIQSLVRESLLTLNKIEKSNDVSVTLAYNSNSKELRNLPPKIQILRPNFNAKALLREDIQSRFGSLTPLSISTQEDGYYERKQQHSERQFLNVHELVSTINTGYHNLQSICLSAEDELWTSGRVSDVKCFNTQGFLLKTVRTISGEMPNDIALTSHGDLLYTDWKSMSVNEVKKGQIEEVIRMHGWTPVNLCVTASGDLLVAAYSDDQTQSKIVRYINSTEKQTLQFDDDGKPLFSGNNFIKYIAENGNMDICVADNGAPAVVVINQDGKLRFRYDGHCTTTNEGFHPFGITTDSRKHILIADSNNHCIHILNEDGQFQVFISIDLCDPWGLCVDKNDHLHVAELISGNVKKIRYLKSSSGYP